MKELTFKFGVSPVNKTVLSISLIDHILNSQPVVPVTIAFKSEWSIGRTAKFFKDVNNDIKCVFNFNESVDLSDMEELMTLRGMYKIIESHMEEDVHVIDKAVLLEVSLIPNRAYPVKTH